MSRPTTPDRGYRFAGRSSQAGAPVTRTGVPGAPLWRASALRWVSSARGTARWATEPSEYPTASALCRYVAHSEADVDGGGGAEDRFASGNADDGAHDFVLLGSLEEVATRAGAECCEHRLVVVVHGEHVGLEFQAVE